MTPDAIRLRIYETLLLSNTYNLQLELDSAGLDSWPVVIHLRRCTYWRQMRIGILQTCKQAFAEAAPILCSKHTLSVGEERGRSR